MGIFGGSWIPIILVILIVAYKNLPLVWHVRFLRTLLTRLFISPVTKKQLSPECLFLPAIHRTRSPLTECDYNIHKSNSTYFTDLDISRGNLSLLLFSQRLSLRPTPNTAVMILSGVQCVFRKEIRPYQPYEVWSRVLSWDEKWIYIVSHFVERDAFRPREYYLQRKKPRGCLQPTTPSQGDQVQKKVFASAVSRYVFKQGQQAGSEGKEARFGDAADKRPTWRSIEERRKRDLDAAQLRLGWDAVHNAFDGDVTMALGRYTDLLWR
ncbi:hypothetical protein VTN00DRAFT_6662 [Thermoascus crustaceus]|uniref:uncharacterized protein n=1 Tax=Thermoascus crustaceus TaxID=5088 RepID=UPI0037445A9A